MDRISENWKKFPLLVVGEAAQWAIPGAISLPLASLQTPGGMPTNDFYVLVSLPTEEISQALTLLEANRVTPDQIVVLLPLTCSFSNPNLPFLGVLDLIDGECGEEFRARLLGKLEGQRQKKLVYAMHEASHSGIVRKLSENDLQRTLDTARIAHALACSFGFLPVAHAKVLQTCLEGSAIKEKAWTADMSPDQLICEAANFIVHSAAREGLFRDALREKASALPFKVRTELLHNIENCLGLVLGGRSHAA